MNDHGETRTQNLAVILLFMGLVAIAVADVYNMRDLANAGTVVVGAGVGLLTGKMANKALTQTTATGDIKNTDTPPPTSGQTA